jgi:hypothetical protein
MSTNLDDIKLKIKALAAKTVERGCTEHEALSAMAGVGRLLQRYNLTMNELDVRDSTYKTIYIDIERAHRHPIDDVTLALARLLGVKTWFHRRHRTSAYAFFGQVQDLEFIEYLFNVCLRALDTDTERFKNSKVYQNPRGHHRRTLSVSFQRGMAERIAERIDEIHQQNDAQYAAQHTGRSLVVLKKELVEEAFEKEGIQLRTSMRYVRLPHPQAHSHGRRAGDKVNLSRPVPKQARPAGHLR